MQKLIVFKEFLNPFLEFGKDIKIKRVEFLPPFLPQIYHKLNLLNVMVGQMYVSRLYCATLIVEREK